MGNRLGVMGRFFAHLTALAFLIAILAYSIPLTGTVETGTLPPQSMAEAAPPTPPVSETPAAAEEPAALPGADSLPIPPDETAVIPEPPVELPPVELPPVVEEPSSQPEAPATAIVPETGEESAAEISEQALGIADTIAELPPAETVVEPESSVTPDPVEAAASPMADSADGDSVSGEPNEHAPAMDDEAPEQAADQSGDAVDFDAGNSEPDAGEAPETMEATETEPHSEMPDSTDIAPVIPDEPLPSSVPAVQAEPSEPNPSEPMAVATPLPSAHLEVLGDGVYWLDSEENLPGELANIPDKATIIFLTPGMAGPTEVYPGFRTVAVPAGSADLTRDAAAHFIHLTSGGSLPAVVVPLSDAPGTAYFKGVFLLVNRNLSPSELGRELAPDLDKAGDARNEIEHRLGRLDADSLRRQYGDGSVDEGAANAPEPVESPEAADKIEAAAAAPQAVDEADSTAP